jgi:hypothetical protein
MPGEPPVPGLQLVRTVRCMVTRDDREARRRFLVEVAFPGAGMLRADELRAVAARTGRAVEQLRPGLLRWEVSEIAVDRLFARYLANDEELLRQHLLLVGLPEARITPIVAVIDGTTASGSVGR